MQLDKLQAVLRQRTSFEAFDLGVAMVRRWRGPVYKAWFPVVLPSYALIWALLHNHPFWAFLLLWLLIPLWDRVPLFVISRALFGDEQRLRDTLRATPGLLVKHLFYSLLLYRLDPARSFFLPVLQLEGGDWRNRPRRRSALLRNMGGPSAWLTVVFLFLHVVMFVGFMIFVILMLPDRPEWSLVYLWERVWDGTAPWWFYAWIPVAEFLSLTLIEPLYVASGFALYLNRRTQLEGWDIELTFRRLAERLRSTGHRSEIKAAVSLVALGVAALLSMTLWAGSAFAQPSKLDPAEFKTDPQISQEPNYPYFEPDRPFEPAPPLQPTRPFEPAGPFERAATLSGNHAPPVDPEAAVAKVLERPEFGEKVKRWVWQRRNPAEEEDEEPWELPSFLEFIGRFLAAGIEGLLWVLAGIVLVGAVLLIVSRLKALGPTGGGGQREPLPDPRVGTTDEEGRSKVLPSDVPAAALSAWEAGYHADALALLYRGSIVIVSERWTISIEENATEGECLRTVRKKAPEAVATFFEAITRTWQTVAYAHRIPDDAQVRELCSQWTTHFGATS